MKVSITTLGCKSNQYDSSALEEQLKASNISVVPFPQEADAYIINTCTVTGKTDYQSRQLVRKVKKINPSSLVIVTGCYAQVSPDEVKNIEGVDYILGNPEKGKVLEFLLKGRAGKAVTEVGSYEAGTPFTLRARSSSGRTRANLKVQDGCNKACSYCIIPKARGLSKSLPLAEVEKEIDLLAANGYKEIILTGIHLGAYGHDLAPQKRLTHILELIEKKDIRCRFRISSLDPDEVTDELIDLLGAAEKICNHMHLPLQSGDDSVIRGMRRPYTAKDFERAVEKLFTKIPEISIGADVIAGFPGEGDKEFENTYSLIDALPIAYLHVFPFSKRRGTPAAVAKGQVKGDVIKERCRQLKELDLKKREKFYRISIGSRAAVLVEGRDKESGLLTGRSSNYIPVYFDGPDGLKNAIIDVILKEPFLDGMAAGMNKGQEKI